MALLSGCRAHDQLGKKIFRFSISDNKIIIIIIIIIITNVFHISSFFLVYFYFTDIVFLLCLCIFILFYLIVENERTWTCYHVSSKET